MKLSLPSLFGNNETSREGEVMGLLRPESMSARCATIYFATAVRVRVQKRRASKAARAMLFSRDVSWW